MASRGALLRCWLLVVCLAAGSHAWKKSGGIEDKLADWVISKGGKLKGCKIGRECPTCLRGIVATKDFKDNDLIMKVPFETVMRLKDIAHNGFPAEYARDLLESMHNDPAHNATWSLFWEAHPGPDGTFTPEVYTDAHIALLQCAELESLAEGQREVTEQVYDGTYPYHTYAPFNETVPEDKVNLDTFKYVSSLLGSRYFGFYRDGQNDNSSSHLVPMVDLINHSDDPNAARSDDGVSVMVRALRPIKKGEEITNNYQPGVIHRPDMSLYIYGFVIEREQPFLAAVDLPGFDEADPFGQTPETDDELYGEGGNRVTRAEHNRLAARLAALPTTEEEDQALVDGGSITDWREQAILRFRVMRKRALKQTIAKLAAALEAAGDDGSTAAAGEAETAEDGGDGDWEAEEGEESEEAEEEGEEEAGGHGEL